MNYYIIPIAHDKGFGNIAYSCEGFINREQFIKDVQNSDSNLANSGIAILNVISLTKEEYEQYIKVK